jgi:exodeoxyribonuclease VII small subunit
MIEKEPTIEAALARLEEIAEKLEDPETSLEIAVRLYEEGLELYRRCTAQLDSAELKIVELSKALEQQGRR